MEQTVLQRPEILAPAGNADMLRACILSTSDAADEEASLVFRGKRDITQNKNYKK